MSIFKKILDNLKPGKGRETEPGLPQDQQSLHLRRANAKIHKKNQSSLNIRNDFKIRDGNIFSRSHVDLRPAVSRNYSFGPADSVEHFNIESDPIAVQKHAGHDQRCKCVSPEPPVFRPRLAINTTNAKIPNRFQFSAPNLPNLNHREKVAKWKGSSIGRYGLKAHPNDLRTEGHSNSGASSQNLDPFECAMVTLERWNTVLPVQEEPISPDFGDVALIDRPRHAEASRSKDSSRIPKIGELDWNKLTDEEVRKIAIAYGELAQFRNPGSSPADSACAFVGRDGKKTDNGKGKERQVGDRPSSDHREFETFEGQISDANATGIEKLQHLEGQSDRIREEQDRIRARELADEWRLEQEEQDRIRAEELQEQWILEQEEADRLAAERARHRECVVCGDTKDPFEFPAKPPTATCEHTTETCQDCLEQWMASEFDTKGLEGIKCPNCPSTLDYIDIQAAASTETFEAYDKLATRTALGMSDEFAWCLGPNCGNGQFNTENNNYMDCMNCGYKQCLTHKVPWHTNETCDQYEYRTSGAKAREDERQTEAMIDTISKLCPGQNCGWRIQKIEGCEHMTCKRCKHEFCWLCLASHQEIRRVGNTAHAASCKFHSTNLEVTWPFNMH